MLWRLRNLAYSVSVWPPPLLPSKLVGVLFLCSSSQNCSFSRIPFGCRERCGGVLMMGCLPSSSALSPQRVWVRAYESPFMTLFGGSVYNWLPETFADLPQVDWSGPSPYQSARILDRSDPSPKITRTGPGLDWTGPVRTIPHPDYWNHCTIGNIYSSPFIVATPSTFLILDRWASTVPPALDECGMACSNSILQIASITTESIVEVFLP